MSNYNELSKEELLEILEKKDTELARKYGIFWDSEKIPEDVVTDCENNLPVLERVKEKEIKNNSPVEATSVSPLGISDQPTHILIEGDNYHALTVLNYTHKEKIDVIYIDPPYNTGNKDFTYNDRYVDKEDGYRHSKWLNFMEKRLKLAKNLLTDKGVIFISIDDNEQAQLKLLCNEVFKEDNFIGQLIIETATDNNPRQISTQHEYMLCYAKNKLEQPIWIGTSDGAKQINDKYLELKQIYQTDIQTIQKELRNWIKENKSILDKVSHYRFVDEKGVYYPDNPSNTKPGGYNYDVFHPITKKICKLPGNGYRFKKETFDKMLEAGDIEFGKDESIVPKPKRRLNDVKDLLRSLYYEDGRVATQELAEILDKNQFNNPKSKKLLKHILSFIPDSKNSTILDFMAGSGTTGQAVLELNKEDGGNRQFILCTNNELNGVGSQIVESEKLKVNNENFDPEKFGICQRVTYPRLEKVINGYNKNGGGEWIDGLGGNLQYYKTDFVKKVNNRDQIRFNLVNKCTEMLCVKESIFEEYDEKSSYKIFISNDKKRFLCVYYNFLKFDVDQFVEEISKLDGQKQVYIFSETKEPDLELFYGIKNCEIQAIPEPIFAVYEELIKLVKN